MRVLHSYSDSYPERQKETWAFVSKLRSLGFQVTSRLCDGQNGYNDFVAEFWDKGEDLIILEMDMVPTMKDFYELMNCPETHCRFPYRSGSTPIAIMRSTKAKLFGEMYGLGFVKISAYAQHITPLETWYRRNNWFTLDRAIGGALAQSLGDYHFHERFVKHNHPYDWKGPRQTIKGVILIAEVVANRRFQPTVLAKNIFGDYYGQRLVMIVKMNGFWSKKKD